MARTYKKNARNIFVIPVYRKFGFWWLISLVSALLLTGIEVLYSRFANAPKWLLWTSVGLWLLVALLLILKAVSVSKRIRKAGSFSNYLVETRCEKEVTKSLLATMTVNRLQDTPFISVPEVAVVVKLPQQLIFLELEKLAGMYELDKLTEDINSSFRGKLSSYAVISSMITEDGLTYKFVLEPKTDRTWRPATLKAMKQKSHEIKLQEGLTLNLADSPHIIAWGKSGSGKSTLLFSIILQLFMMSADVRFIDPKTEFSAFKEFYPADKIAEDTERILELLRDVCKELRRRQRLVAKGVRERQKIGLRAYDLGMKPIVVLADEIGSAVSGMDSKQKKEFMSLLTQIVQKGRSCSVFCIIATQSPKVDTTLSSDIRNQFATKILLGSANGDTQRMAFDGEVTTKGDVERFHGFYISDGKTNEQPLSFAVPDLHAHDLVNLEEFKRAYEIGS